MDKIQFLLNEVITLSMVGGLSTRNKNFPIYKPVSEFERDGFKRYIRMKLYGIYSTYNGRVVSEIELYKLIQSFAIETSNIYSNILHNEKLRIGVSQKVVNLMLKFLWCLDIIDEPPHCPFDSIIKNKLGDSTLKDWTSMDNVDDYQQYVRAAKDIATKSGLSIAKWELESWNPNNIQ